MDRQPPGAAFRFMTSEKHWNTICYVDGFNLYHAIDNLKRPGAQRRQSLGARGVTPAGSENVSPASSTSRPMRSGYPTNTAGTRYTFRALEAAGVTANMAHFKERDVTCRSCGHTWVSREEKETDVRLALKIFEHAVDNMFDRAHHHQCGFRPGAHRPNYQDQISGKGSLYCCAASALSGGA